MVQSASDSMVSIVGNAPHLALTGFGESVSLSTAAHVGRQGVGHMTALEQIRRFSETALLFGGCVLGILAFARHWAVPSWRWIKTKFGHPETREPPGISTQTTSTHTSPPAPSRLAPTQPIASAPNPETVRKSLTAFEHPDDPSLGVDLEHFVHAQTRLAERRLSPEILSRLFQRLELESQALSDESASEAITHALAKSGYTKDIVDLINSIPDERNPAILKSTYTDPRLDVTIIGQNPNPRAQGVYEGVSNSLDAILKSVGLQIGQFGKGVKQIIDWLEPTGEDRLDVVSRPANSTDDEPWRHLQITKDTVSRHLKCNP